MPSLRKHPRGERRLRLFAANELNVVGWVALVMAMLVAGLVAGIAAQALNLSVPVLAFAGSALVLALVVAADRRHLGSLSIGFSRWSPSQACEVQALAARLRSMGFDVTYEAPDQDEAGGGPGLRVRRSDWPSVRRLIDAPL